MPLAKIHKRRLTMIIDGELGHLEVHSENGTPEMKVCQVAMEMEFDLTIQL